MAASLTVQLKVLTVLTALCQTSVSAQESLLESPPEFPLESPLESPLKPAYLKNTFFGGPSLISVPELPENIIQSVSPPGLTVTPLGLTVFSKLEDSLSEAQPREGRQTGLAQPGRFTFQPQVASPQVRALLQSPHRHPAPPPYRPPVSSLPLTSNVPFGSQEFSQIPTALFRPQNIGLNAVPAVPAVPTNSISPDTAAVGLGSQPSPPPQLARFPPRDPLPIKPLTGQPFLQGLRDQPLQSLQLRPHPQIKNVPRQPPVPDFPPPFTGGPPSPPPPSPPPPPPPSSSRSPVQLQIGPVVPAVPGAQPFKEENAGAPVPVKSFQTQPGLGLGQPLINTIPDRIERNCKTTFREECHNEYKMVCEETTVERDRHVCETVQEKVCQERVNTEYEPACFQRIISHCDGVCKRSLDVSCEPQCARSLAAPYCHKVKVVTPYNTCRDVPREVCSNKKVTVPYEKCHDEPKKVCEKIEKKLC